MERLFKVVRRFAPPVVLPVLLLGGPVPVQADDATFEIDGLGFFGDRRMRNLVMTLRSEDAPEGVFDLSFIENGLYIVDARLEGDGYLRPEYTLELTPADGSGPMTLSWNGEALLDVPPGLQATSVKLNVNKGVFFYYEDLHFQGLEVMPADEARAYFYTERFMLFTGNEKVFSPAGMESSARSLRSVLNSRGYQDATVMPEVLSMDETTGAVTVQVTVDSGPQHRVRSVINVLDGYERAPGVEEIQFGVQHNPDVPYDQVWEQDYGREVLREFYRAGYAQAEARFVIKNRDRRDGKVFIDGELHVRPGPRIRVGEVHYLGSERTKRSVLRRRAETGAGGWLDPVQMDQDRFRLAQLPAFERVEVGYQHATTGAPNGDTSEPPVVTRDVTFRMEETDRLNVDLLFGYGSYDQLRGGFEVSRENLWGRAHSDSLLFVQSFVSTLVEYRYRMPEFFDINNDITGRLRWLRREEISFLRRETGGEIRLSRDLQQIEGATASVGYRLQRVEAVGLEDENFLDEARVGSLFLNFALDRLDNPVFPEEGWMFRSEAQAGATLLGGEVDFQRLLLEGSYHRKLGDTTLLHVGLRWGMVGSFSGQTDNIPVNERFFPGGEDSIRGYTEGEASPVNAQGEQIGAENFFLPSIEVEQFFAENLSGVIFVDSLLMSDNWGDYLGQDFLMSVGLGARYRTVVGPLRLEGGYNVVKRENDPSWSIHLSLGYPF